MRCWPLLTHPSGRKSYGKRKGRRVNRLSPGALLVANQELGVLTLVDKKSSVNCRMTWKKDRKWDSRNCSHR